MTKLFTFALLALLAMLSACDDGGNDLDLDLRADEFVGGAATDFEGPDADDAGATAEGAAMVEGRNFDFTPNGFSLSSGNINSQPVDGDSDYTITGGNLDVDGDTATVDLDVTSANPDVSGVDLRGSFSLGQAQGAIVNPGRSFTVDWDVSFEYLGLPVAFTMQQELTGDDFVAP